MNSGTSEEVTSENLKFNPFSTNKVLLSQYLDPDVNFYNNIQNLLISYFSTNDLSSISERTKLESHNFLFLHINIRCVSKCVMHSSHLFYLWHATLKFYA